MRVLQAKEVGFSIPVVSYFCQTMDVDFLGRFLQKRKRGSHFHSHNLQTFEEFTCKEEMQCRDCNIIFFCFRRFHF